MSPTYTITTIPTLMELDPLRTLDMDLLNRATDLVAQMFKENERPLTDSVDVWIWDFEKELGQVLSEEVAELLLLRIVRSGWNTKIYKVGSRIRAIHCSPNLKDLNV